MEVDASSLSPLPMNKDALLSEVDKCTYRDRVARAALLGRQNANSPQLQELIKELRTHPAPEAPNMEVEEEFVKILPPQQINGKFYHEDHIALTAAVASGPASLDVIQQELFSPSISFKKLVAKGFVKHQKDDDKVFEAIMAAPPAVAKKLIHKCIRFRRVAVLEKSVPALLERDGVAMVSGFLHGCSSAVVAARLSEAQFLNCPKLKWKELVRYHGQVVIDLIRKDLAAFHSDSWANTRQTVWTTWEGRISTRVISKEMLRNANLSGEIWKLHVEYPVQVFAKTYVNPKPPVAETPAEWIRIELPSVIKSNVDIFFKKQSKVLMGYYIDSITTSEDLSKCLESQLPQGFWDGGLTRKLSPAHAFDLLMDMIKAIIAKSTPQSLYKGRFAYGVGINSYLLSSYVGSAIKGFYLSVDNLITLAEVIHAFLMKMKPTTEAYTEWGMKTTEVSLSTAVKTWKEWCRSLYTKILSELQKREQSLIEREEALERNEVTKVSQSDTKKRRKGKASKRNARLRAKQPRKEKTESEREEEKKRLAQSKATVVKGLEHFLKRYVALITDEEGWRWLNAFVPQNEEGKGKLTKEAKKKDRVLKDLQRRRIEAKNVMTALNSFGASHPDLVLFVFEHAFLHFADGQSLEDSAWESDFRSYGTQFLKMLHSTITNKKAPEASRKEAVKIREQLFTYFHDIFASDALVHASALDQMARYCLQEQNLRSFTAITYEQLEHLGQQNSTLLLSMIKHIFANYDEEEDLKTDTTEVWKMVDRLLKEADLSEETKDTLKAYQNIRDAAVKKALIKAMDSNSSTERLAAIETLFKSSLLHNSVADVMQVMTQLQKKIKNENIDMREDVISALVIHVSGHKVLLSADCLPIWKTLLQDALDAPDADVRRIGYKFREISSQALTLSAKAPESVLFDFAIDIQWELARYEHGSKKCYTDFRISIPPAIVRNSDVLPKGTENSFVNAIIKAYQKRISLKSEETFKEFMKDTTVLLPLYNIVQNNWHHIPALCEHVQLVIDSIKEREKDMDGLYILEHDADELDIFDKVFGFHRDEDWNKIIPLRDLVDTILHSRQAKKVLFAWLALNSAGKTKSERRANREACVFKLLEISPSAIYYRFVWRHLLRYRQDKLDEFINAKKSFRGVFYVPPEERKISLKRGKGKRSVGLKLVKAERDVERILEEEEEAELDLEDERKEWLETHPGEDFDHPDFFCIEGCYGLRRLLPRQSEQLALQRRAQVLNTHRALPERVKATIRWTLLPSTEYKEIVQFYEEYAKQSEKKLPVNVIEAALRGVMECPEPCVPLHFLLSPKFLNSDRARVASFAISKCIPHMQSTQLTEALRMALTPSRRKLLKVTAYKEIIRLLASRPILAHMKMIRKEWHRPDLHRDVRLLIIQKAFGFLEVNGGEEIGWNILKAAAENENPEILTALLTAEPVYEKFHAPPSGVSSTLCKKTRLFEHMMELKKGKLMQRNHERFIKEILLPLCKSTVDDDVAALAICSLPKWMGCISLQQDMAMQLSSVVTNVTKDCLHNIKTDIQAIHDARYNTCINGMFQICGVSKDNENPDQKIKEILTNALMELIAAVKVIPREEREMRNKLMDRIKTFSTLIPTSPSTYFSAEQRDALASPLLGMGSLYWKFFIEKGVEAVISDFHKRNPVAETIKDLLHNMFTHVSENTTEQKWAISKAVSMFPANAYSYSNITEKSMIALLKPAIDALIEGKLTKETIKPSPKYLHLVRVVTLKVLKLVPKYFFENTAAVKHYLLQALHFAGDKENTWSAPVSWVLQEVEGVVLAIAGSNKSAVHYTGATKQVVDPEACELISDIVNLWLSDPLNEKNSLAVHLCGAMVKNFISKTATVGYVLIAVPDKLLLILHRLINAAAASPAPELKALNDSIGNILRVIDSHAVDLEKESGAWMELTSHIPRQATLYALEALFSNKLQSADPIPFPGQSQQQRGESAKDTPAPAYENVWLLTCLYALELYPIFLTQRDELGKRMLHQIIVWIVGYNGDIPEQSPEDIKSRIVSIVSAAFSPLIYSDSMPDHEELNTFAAQQIISFIDSIRTLSLLGSSERNDSGRGFLLGPYRNFCQHLALDLLIFFGNKLTIEVPKTAEGTKEKEKEKEESEKSPEGKEKGSSSKKRKQDIREMVWRPAYERMLDQFCDDTDQSVSWRAMAVITRTQQKGVVNQSQMKLARAQRFVFDI